MRIMIGVVLAISSIITARGNETNVSPRETLSDLTQTYTKASLRPDLAFSLKYNPPFLEVSWQRKVELADQPARLDNVRVSIDLRYAHFDAWNDGRRDRNVIIIDCWNYFPCYNDQLTQRAYGHGEIDYYVLEYAADSISGALNHLAAINEKSRPRPKFQ